ncbi:hypothetical protein [Saccharibacillus alkalitolerans]|uniref:Helix-turn-helix domain-containing protein n=1 Tax=Saccharibacillus alkalitolerans TaxID=2705290 RepID=A0ABX0F1V6_9BACL|nr:hypothetical protein [Saccharibacillus alkalitolerans]NGZ74480.1 hypothetical protein [Saccharibacillus alkalitolerans]
MEMSRLERKILVMLRRHRWSAYRFLTMARLLDRTGGAFREVAIALINLEQYGCIRWPDKSSLRHIVLLRRAYSRRAMLPVMGRPASEDMPQGDSPKEETVTGRRNLRIKRRRTVPKQS